VTLKTNLSKIVPELHIENIGRTNEISQHIDEIREKKSSSILGVNKDDLGEVIEAVTKVTTELKKNFE
jgi:hypothetical protein